MFKIKANSNLEVEFASIAERCTRGIPSPERGLPCPTLGTHWLLLTSSKTSGGLWCPWPGRLLGYWVIWKTLGHKEALGVLGHSGKSIGRDIFRPLYRWSLWKIGFVTKY